MSTYLSELQRLKARKEFLLKSKGYDVGTEDLENTDRSHNGLGSRESSSNYIVIDSLNAGPPRPH